ncbi:hypothetical protein ACLOJK_004328 [Asimina triloba]
MGGTATGLLRDAFMSALPKEAHALVETFSEGATCRSCSDALIGVDDGPSLIDADNDSCLRQGSRDEEEPLVPHSSLCPPFPLTLSVVDLNVIREGYVIPSIIVISAPAAHKTPRDNRPGHLCLNEYMLGAEVRNDGGIAETLWAFNVPPARVVPHSWKVIQTMAWYYEHRGCSADRYLWRELLTHRLS